MRSYVAAPRVAGEPARVDGAPRIDDNRRSSPRGTTLPQSAAGDNRPRTRWRHLTPCPGDPAPALLSSSQIAEAVLRVGDRVWITGVLVYARGGEHGYRDRLFTMRLVGQPGQRLTIGRARRGPHGTTPGRRRQEPKSSELGDSELGGRCPRGMEN